jgi:hypothetical protein
MTDEEKRRLALVAESDQVLTSSNAALGAAVILAAQYLDDYDRIARQGGKYGDTDKVKLAAAITAMMVRICGTHTALQGIIPKIPPDSSSDA